MSLARRKLHLHASAQNQHVTASIEHGLNGSLMVDFDHVLDHFGLKRYEKIWRSDPDIS